MSEIKLNRGPVEQKLQDVKHVVSQVEVEGFPNIRGKNSLEAIEKINQLNQRLEQLTQVYQDVSTKHINSALGALDALEEKEKMAAKGIEMIES